MSIKSYVEKNSVDLLNKLSGLTKDELSELVAYHNHKYFIENEIEISDEAFDKLTEALRIKNPKSPQLTQFVAQISNQLVHKTEMLSLDKCYEDETFEKWLQKINGSIVSSPKIDGIACSLIYDETGKLTAAATRGDGKVGENITDNVLQIVGISQYLDQALVSTIISSEKYLEVRGEIFMPISRFNEFFADKFSNPRNLAAGAIKLKDAHKSKSYGLSFLAYDLRGDNLLTYEEKFKKLKAFGFLMMPYFIAKDLKEAQENFKYFLDHRADFDFETDGVVFKASSVQEQRRLGYTAHHPKYAIAYKFQSEIAQTKIMDIEWSVARSGVITPVAIFAPVIVAGAKISRASLHNLGLFLKYDIRTNSLVEISRRGGVIPKLERVLGREGEPFLPPTICPSCHGSVLVQDDFLYCKNPDQCSNVQESSIIHFCQVLGMEGLGPKLIKKLINEGFVTRFADIFRLNTKELLTLERMGEVLANKIIAEINKKRKISLKIFIQALGIHEVAENVSALVAENFLTLEKIRSLQEEDLNHIHGIGEKIAHSLVAGLKAKKAEIDELLSVLQIENYEIKNENLDVSHALYGKSVLFTGAMAIDRKIAQEMVKKFGGSTPGSVSKKLDYLVIGDDAKKSSKQVAAEKLIKAGEHVKIITEKEFYKMVGL